MAYDYGGYERAKGDVDYKYSRDAVNNAYGRFISQQRGNRQLGDMTRQFGRGHPQVSSQFNRRGLSGANTSGVQRSAMQQYVGDYGRDFMRGQQDLTQQLQQYDLGQADLDQWRNQSLGAIEAQKANDIANAAEGIQYIKSIFGGM